MSNDKSGARQQTFGSWVKALGGEARPGSPAAGQTAHHGNLPMSWSWRGQNNAEPKTYWSGWDWGGFTFEDYEPINDGTQVIAHDGYDVTQVTRETGKFSELGRLISAASKTNPTARSLVNDIFFALKKRSVRKHETPLRDSHLLNEELVDAMLANPEYETLHSEVLGDSYLSSRATAQMAQPILGALSDETKARLQRQLDLEQQVKILMAQRDALEELAASRGNEMLHKRAEELAAKVLELQAAIEKTRANLSQEELGNIQLALGAGLGEAIKQARDLNAGFGALGGGLGGKDLAWAVGQTSGMGRNPLSNEQKIKIAAALQKNEKIKLVALMAGKMADIALEIQASKVPEPTDELTDIKQGRTISRLVSAEYAALSDEDLELMFYYRFASQTLAEYEIIGYNPQGRGPMIVMVDNSGSMSGDPEVWSKGVMLALQLIARQQHRDFLVIHFDSTVKRVLDFPLGVADPDKALEAIEFFSGGGTNFEPPMREALKALRQSRYNRADCIFITDGLCAIRDEECKDWNDLRQARDMRSYCILIGDERWGADVMRKITDSLMVIKDVSLEQDVNSTVLQTIFSV